MQVISSSLAALAAVVCAALVTHDAQATEVPGAIYLRCDVEKGAQFPANAPSIVNVGERTIQIAGGVLSEWNAASGRFETYREEGVREPTLDLSPLRIVFTRYENVAPRAPLPFGQRIEIDRQTGAYRLQETWFGNPWVDVKGFCQKIEKPQPPKTQF